MGNISEIDHGISSEDEDDFENKMSWYESEPELDALSDTNSETNGIDTESEDENLSVSQEIRGLCFSDQRTEIQQNYFSRHSEKEQMMQSIQLFDQDRSKHNLIRS